MTPRPTPAGRCLAAAVVAYRRWVSPAFPATCRFAPTCSGYAVEALRTRGAIVGLLLTAWRVLRCHPFHPGGYDPVPPSRRNSSSPATVLSASQHSGAAR